MKLRNLMRNELRSKRFARNEQTQESFVMKEQSNESSARTWFPRNYSARKIIKGKKANSQLMIVLLTILILVLLYQWLNGAVFT